GNFAAETIGGFQDQYLAPGQRERTGDRETDNARAYDDGFDGVRHVSGRGVAQCAITTMGYIALLFINNSSCALTLARSMISSPSRSRTNINRRLARSG